MLDNMAPDTLREALERIPSGIESEVSGGVNLSTIADIGRIGPDYVSVGRLTHSAPAADFSMRVRITHG
jgi:nicotinate-nucleotide pyrophosphorylase (carboxylating)